MYVHVTTAYAVLENMFETISSLIFCGLLCNYLFAVFVHCILKEE